MTARGGEGSQGDGAGCSWCHDWRLEEESSNRSGQAGAPEAAARLVRRRSTGGKNKLLEKSTKLGKKDKDKDSGDEEEDDDVEDEEDDDMDEEEAEDFDDGD